MLPNYPFYNPNQMKLKNEVLYTIMKRIFVDFTRSESKLDYYQEKVTIRVTSQAAEPLKRLSFLGY